MPKILALLCFCMLTVVYVNPSIAADEAALPTQFQTEILPRFESGRKGSFTGKGGVPIAWRAFQPADSASFKGARALVILNGRSEFMRKYAELVYDLRKSGYTIYLMDHRGQGESGRMLPEARLGHVESYDDYVDDFGAFLNQVVLKDGVSEVHVLAHSMGATIATIYAIKHPTAFRSMVLTAPMYKPNLGKYPEWVALTIASFMSTIGKSTDSAPGRGLDDWRDPFETNRVTNSRVRFGYALELLNARPEQAIGGLTYRWLQQAILACRWARHRAEKLVTPVRILQAGDESVVINSYQNMVCARAKSCDLQVLEGSKHETLMETDAHRNRAIQLALEWMNRHSAHNSN